MPASLSSPSANGLPLKPGGSASVLSVSRPARRSLAFRPAWSLSRPWRPLTPECFRPYRCLHDPPWLLPTGATVVGRGSHPLEEGAFPRRTGPSWITLFLLSFSFVSDKSRPGRAEFGSRRTWQPPPPLKKSRVGVNLGGLNEYPAAGVGLLSSGRRFLPSRMHLQFAFHPHNPSHGVLHSPGLREQERPEDPHRGLAEVESLSRGCARERRMMKSGGRRLRAGFHPKAADRNRDLWPRS